MMSYKTIYEISYNFWFSSCQGNPTKSVNWIRDTLLEPYLTLPFGNTPFKEVCGKNM